MKFSSWFRSGSWSLALGAWLTAKQVVWSPQLHGGESLAASAIAASATVALVVLGLALRLEGRRQLAALLAVDVVLSGLHQVHLLYDRQFSELASVAALSFAPQTAHVAGAVSRLLRPTDALLWIDVVALAAGAALRWTPPRAPRALANGLVAAALLLVIPPVLPLVDRPLTGPRRLSTSRAEVAASLGLVGYQVYDAAAFLRGRLDRSGRGSLVEAVAYHAGRAAPAGPLTGSQRGRNVIVVQLESVQAFAVGRAVGGVPVTPTLDALAGESLQFTRAFTQVAQGTSSDAELLAECSLHPLETGAVFTDRYDVRFRCLPEILRDEGYRTVAMHANWPNFWNRERMYPAMGFERFLSIADFDREPAIGLGLSDARFFEQAVERMQALPRPFHAHLVTLSNHAPFDDPRLPRSLPLGALAGTYVGDYLRSVRFADAALGVLVERLRATGLLDESILVVYGDHGGVSRTASGTELLELPPRPDAWLQHEARVPLLVRLPHGAAAGARDEPVGQVDIAPTIADLLGASAGRTFFHGRSLVSEPPRPVVLPEGSCVTAELVHLGRERRWGPPGCLDAESGSPVAGERCDAIAEHAARELALSRAEVNQDLFRWMIATAPDR